MSSGCWMNFSNINNKELAEALPAAAREPHGATVESWQDNQRRADQYLHRAAANDWWYSMQQTVDTEWF